MRRLGAILAGGEARRFAGDKGAALFDGRALIDHVADGLRGQVDALVVVGRDWPGLERVDDSPEPGLGPLGGLCGALGFAAEHGFEGVVAHPCDLLPVPDWSGVAHGSGSFFAAGHYACGVWPTSHLDRLRAYLTTDGNRSMRSWIAMNGARGVECGPMKDFNTRAALKDYSRPMPPDA